MRGGRELGKQSRVIIREAGIWGFFAQVEKKLAAASELSVWRDGHLALHTISRDEFLRVRVSRGTNSPADALSRKRIFFEATLPYTILPVDTLKMLFQLQIQIQRIESVRRGGN